MDLLLSAETLLSADDLLVSPDALLYSDDALLVSADALLNSSDTLSAEALLCGWSDALRNRCPPDTDNPLLWQPAVAKSASRGREDDQDFDRDTGFFLTSLPYPKIEEI